MARTPMWRRYLRFWGSDVRADVDAELDFHMRELVERLVREGRDPAEARAEAARRFGDYARVEAACVEIDQGWQRQRRWRQLVVDLWQDLWIGVRTLAKNLGFTTSAVVVLPELREQLCPAEPRIEIPGHAVHAPPDPVEPPLEALAASSGRQQENAEAHLAENDRIDRQAALVVAQPVDYPRIRRSLRRLGQDVGIDQVRHDGGSMDSVDSDGIGWNQSFSGQARSVCTSPWFLGGSVTTRRYSPFSIRSISNVWPGWMPS